jgi:hypothetical protein
LDAASASSVNIRTPDQRLRVFVSSTLQELAAERTVAQSAITRLRLTATMFELGARPHPPRDLSRAYLAQSEVFVGIYCRQYGWVAPGEEVSGLEDEYLLSAGMPKLIYVKAAEEREPRLVELLDRVRSDDQASYKRFAETEELGELLANDLAVLLAERFAQSGLSTRPGPRAAAPPTPQTAIVGREDEITTVVALLGDPEVHLVTLVGPGGIGKTRLALEVARLSGSAAAGPEAVSFVDLASGDVPLRPVASVSEQIGLRTFLSALETVALRRDLRPGYLRRRRPRLPGARFAPRVSRSTTIRRTDRAPRQPPWPPGRGRRPPGSAGGRLPRRQRRTSLTPAQRQP